MGNNVNKMSALLIATIASFLTPFMGSSVNIALPAIASEFATDAILLSWIPTAFLLTSAMFAVPFGRIADIYGMKKVFTLGIIIFTIASLLSAMAPFTIALIGFRVLQGIGSAMIFVTGLAIITSAFPPQERGKAIGINIMAVYTGLSLGPVLGGLITHYIGWRSLFYLAVPLGLLVIILIFWKLKGQEWAACKGEKFDLPGSVLYSIALVLVIYGFSSLPDTWGIITIITGILLFLGFTWWELSIDSPVLDMKLFLKNRAFAFSNLAALINYSATFAVTFLLSLYLQYVKGLSAQNAGLILVAQPIIMAITTPFAGRLSDRYEPRILASIGMALVTLGLLIFAFISAQTTFEYIIIGLLVLGLGFGFFSSPNTNAIMGSVERRFFGVASATVSTMRLVGQVLSMGIAMLIFALLIGRVQILPAQYPALIQSIQITFIIFAVLCFGGIFASLARK
ncbi:MFS transporter [Methanobacterium sp.]|uniref:MFS transporter n=1 Tax=Methanobacterium sp. TaxID=2164 RepID=UPI003C76155C